MKRFLQGLVTGLLISSLLATAFVAYASSEIKLIVNGNEIYCDVPVQIIDGRTLVPARFLAEALGAAVAWDEKNNAVVVTTAASSEQTTSSSSNPGVNNSYIAKQFNEGVNIQKYSNGSIDIKIEKDKLPAKMKNFAKMSVCAVSDVTPETITQVVNNTIQFGYGLFPYDPAGYGEDCPSSLYLVLLFDDSTNFLGYYVLRM